MSARVGLIFSSCGIFGGLPTGLTWPALPRNWSCVKFAMLIKASELDLPSFFIEWVGLAAPRPSFSSPDDLFALPTPTRPGRLSSEGLMGMLAVSALAVGAAPRPLPARERYVSDNCRYESLAMGAPAAARGHTQLQSMGSIAATARVRAPPVLNVRLRRDRHPAGRVGLDAACLSGIRARRSTRGLA